MDFHENCIEWVTGDKQATLSITNPKHVNLLRRFIEKGEKEIEIVAENPDGSICAHIPVSWISIRKPVKLNLTAEQREERRRRFRENVG